MDQAMLDRLKRINPWHFVWISIVSSELITLGLSTAQGYLWWGTITPETLIVGAVDALVVPLIVASVVVYFVKHIAELRKNNEQLQEANRKLLELDRLKTDFTSVVSHELRTPLTTIKAFAELLVMKPGMAADRREKLAASINGEADRLTRLVNDLLDLARIESGQMQWRSEQVDLADVVSSTLASMGPLFENKAVTLTTDLASLRRRVVGDRDRLIQVTTNVLSNAVKFTPAGGAVHVAARRGQPPNGHLVVEITDTGCGIPAGDLELIFEKFRRSGEHAADRIDGTGLGLAISRQIIEHHGGRIWAESTAGKGSTFAFSLPAG